MMLSDARSKEQISALRAERDAMAKALGLKGETTQLSSEEESAFRTWAKRNNIRDVDHPDSHYDYRGFWKDNGGPSIRGGVDHFPDTYKQHGHPTFSVESRYSRGKGDGGHWVGENFIPAVDTDGLDAAAERRDREGTEVDLRPAQGYRYRYKNPDAPGAAEGEQFGPMAQDLEKTPAGRSAVRTAPDGTKMVDTGRLALVNTAAVSEQQRRLDEIEALLGASRDQGALTEGDMSAARRFSVAPKEFDLEGLDAAYRRGQREGY